MKILLTGDKGFIGTHLKKALVELKYDIECCDIKESSTQDIRNEGAMKALFKRFKPEVVIHLAARTGVRQSELEPQDYVMTNVYGTYNLLKLSVEYGVKKFLFASSSSVYGNQKCPLKEDMPCDNILSLYAVTKRAGELLCKFSSSTMPVFVFRPFTVYGENGRKEMVVRRLIDCAKSGEVFKKFGDGEQVRGFTNVHDLVDGIINLIEFPILDYKPKDIFEIFNLGGMEKVKLNNLIKIVKEKYPKLKVEQTERNSADVFASWADISKAEKVLGWKPKRDFKEEIKKLCDV